jgi:hypothetical protein
LNLVTNNTHVSAEAWGDRIELHSLDPTTPGASVTLNVSTTNVTGPPTTFLVPARTSFLDTIAAGFHYLFVSNSPAVGDWLQLVVTKTNGNRVTVSVTNTTSGTTIGQLVLTLLNQVNGTPALQSTDGIYGADYNDYDASEGIPAADFNLYAQAPGWPAAQIQVTLSASPDLLVLPPGASLLQDNLSDLQPRNHLYVASGALSLPVNFALDTASFPDGFHELTAVAYEGTSVRTQTRVSRSVRFENTTLSAVFSTLLGGTNTDLNAILQFSVSANTNNVSAIEMFSTGGSLGCVTNQSTAFFSVAGTNLGLGLHPFYAIVTTSDGKQYRTETTWIRLIGPEQPFSVSVASPPTTLFWPSTAGRSYDLLSTSNLMNSFQVAATVIPSNSVAVWTDTNPPSAQRFYRIRTSN